MDDSRFSSFIPASRITVTDPFWLRQMELVRKEVIPYQYEALHDRVEGAEKSWAIDNFRKAGKVAAALREGKDVPVYPVNDWAYSDSDGTDPNAFHGWVFQDSDVYKWLEAVAYSLTTHPDSDLQEKAEEVIDLVCAAQLENGYLDTLYIINDRSKIFTNLRDWHELYCFGHLSEAAWAYHHATGHDRLLHAACRFADLICDTFGPDKLRGYPGHEIAEMALVKLYDLTGKKAYLDTAKFFIDERGRKPYYFSLEHGLDPQKEAHHYLQAHMEPRLQQEAVGHAVRAVYLYSGMADVAKRTGDEGLYRACRTLIDNIMHQKLYITGGIGGTVDGEAFSFNYDLPNDLAYSETCGSIGLVFFGRRMLEFGPDALIGDTVERALYNTVLAGMAEDGKSFFYVNPLEVLPEACHRDSRKRHVRPVRQKWFSCACCPPNLARILSSIGEYCFTENDSTFYIHQYLGCTLSSSHGTVEMESDYSASGAVTIRVTPVHPFSLAIRIPTWCRNFMASLPCQISDGYAFFEINNATGLQLDFSTEPQLVRCSNRVRENVGKAAVARGPFIYCLEEVDNGKDLQRLLIRRDSNFSMDGEVLIAEGLREEDCATLYSLWQEPESEPVTLRLIPYYRWANRGENEMTVYIRVK